MSSDSEYHSSSSPARSPVRRKDENRSRSRSREKKRDHDRDQYRNKRIKFKVPELNGYLVSFKAFLANQADRIGIDVAQKAYDRYKREWEEKQSSTFLTQYKNDAWFREKYDPEVLEALERERKDNVKKNLIEFESHFENGLYDQIDLTASDPKESENLGLKLKGIRGAQSIGYIIGNDNREEEEDSHHLISNQTISLNINSNTDITAQPYYAFDPDRYTLFIKNVPRSISRYDIYQFVGKLQGFKNITLSDPVKILNLARYCWVQFDSDESLKVAQMSMSGLIIKNQPISVSKSFSKFKKIKILKNYPKSRLQADLDVAVAIAKKLDMECGLENNSIINAEFSSSKKKFDTFLLYLRRVHAYDFYTSTLYENERLLTFKVCSIYLRLEADYEQVPGFQTVFSKMHENNLKQLEKSREIDNMGILREEIEKFIRESEKITKEEAANKQYWKCTYCDKKFKTSEFLAKHMISKHNEIKNKKIQLIIEQAYLKDPNKITLYPTRNDDREGFRGKRGGYNSGYRKDRKKEFFKDWDEPEGEKNDKPVSTKPMVNFLDI